MKRTLEYYGAARNLTIVGPKKRVEIEVARLFNYGVISNPVEPRETIINGESAAMVQSDEGRMKKGFESMAFAMIRCNARLLPIVRKRGKGLKKFVAAKASDLIARFEVVKTVYQRQNVGPVYSEGDTHEGIGWNNTTVS